MTTSKDLSNAFAGGIESLEWGLIKNQANVHIHTSDCMRFRYFFDGVKYPCILGYQHWTEGMIEQYLQENAPNCGYYLPELDYDVIRNWEREPDVIGFNPERGSEEEQEQVMEPRYEELKQRMDREWPFVKHVDVCNGCTNFLGPLLHKS